ncbi:type I restriction modification enzyme protein S [Pseudoalteromonas sp. PS1M3]|uniref:restriction endonuclease subunit S n=1 Tax=Pseudoalteromonas sp. PS1M3 TaxID=87791 RepID=UPI00194EB53B|nr:restriction endonuclease subunit S [Pseudoalteromonas sp. PS1M3]BBW90836.1 type I restriction modification enzyme protein S [Pseudoalteromonas sp. PS1M3]
MLFPTHWTIDSLGNLFQTVTGSTPPKSQKDNYGCDVPFVKPPELLNSVIFETADNLSDKGASISRTLPSGSILISCIGNLGKVGINSKVVAFNQQINGIKADDSFVSKFMFYQALSPWFNSQLEELASGTTVPIVNKSKFNSIRVVLPPIPEQKCIVAILDQAFADIEQARAKTEQNLKNARELFESYLQQVFSQRGEGWENKPLGEVAELVDSLHTTPSYIETGGFPMVRVTEIKKSGLNLEKARRVDQETYEKFSKRHKSAVGDIILSRVGASYGVPVIVETDEPFCLGQNTIFILSKVNPYWLYYFLLSPIAKRQIDSVAAGSAQPTVSMKSIRALNLPIPSKSKQVELELKIKNVSAESKKLIKIYTEKLATLDELKKSILQKAFSGELTKEKEGAVA